MLRAESKASINWDIWHNIDNYYWLPEEHDLVELTLELNKIHPHNFINLLSGLERYNDKNTGKKRHKEDFLKIFTGYLVKLEMLNHAINIELPYLDINTKDKLKKFNSALTKLNARFSEEVTHEKIESYKQILLDQANEKLENEILLLQICGRIKNQIKQLKQAKNNHLTLHKPTDEEILLLITLNQLLLTPGHFSEKERIRYFGNKSNKTISFVELINNLISNTNIVKNANFLGSLVREFTDFSFSLCKPKYYTLKKNEHDLDIGEIRLDFDKKKQVLFYQVINPEGDLIKENITKARLEKQLNGRSNAFYEAFNSKHSAIERQVFLADILQITTKREHTNGVRSFRQFHTIMYITGKNKMPDKLNGPFHHLLNKQQKNKASPSVFCLDNIDNLAAEDLLDKIIARHYNIQNYRNSATCSRAEINILNKADIDSNEYRSRFRINKNSFIVRNDIKKDFLLSCAQEARTLKNLNNKEKLKENFHEKTNDKSLVILFFGYDSFISKKTLSYKSADKKLKKILKQIFILKEQGHSQFLICNAPDFSQSPYFLKKSSIEQSNANLIINNFNQQLTTSLALLQKQYPHFAFNIFDLYDFSHEILNHADKYGFSAEYKMAPIRFSNLAILDLYSRGCGFIRLDETQSLLKMYFPNASSYVRRGNNLYYVFNREVEIIPLMTDAIKQFDEAIPYENPVPFLTESELEKIKSITRHFYIDASYNKSKHATSMKEKIYTETFVPQRNTIYYQPDDENDLLQYYVIDGCSRLRYGEITTHELTIQINSCTVSRTAVPPIDDNGNLIIELHSREMYVRYKDKLFYVYITNLGEEKIKSLEISLEILEKFDRKFKPWFTPRHLKLDEIDKIARLLGQGHWHGKDSLLNPEEEKYFENQRSIANCLPAIQIILAHRGHVNADIFTPLTECADFQNYLLEFGKNIIHPPSNKIFHDDLFYTTEASALLAKFMFRQIHLIYQSTIQPSNFEKIMSFPASSSMKECKEKLYSREKLEKFIQLSEAELVTAFHTSYYKMLSGHKNPFFSPSNCSSRKKLSHCNSLETILNLSIKDKYVYNVLIDMQWITKNGELTQWAQKIPALAEMKASKVTHGL